MWGHMQSDHQHFLCTQNGKPRFAIYTRYQWQIAIAGEYLGVLYSYARTTCLSVLDCRKCLLVLFQTSLQKCQQRSNIYQAGLAFLVRYVVSNVIYLTWSRQLHAVDNLSQHARIQRAQEVRTPTPPEKSQSYKFLYNTGPDLLKNPKATQPAFNAGSPSTRKRNAI